MTKRTPDHIAQSLLAIADSQNRLARLKASAREARLEIERSQIQLATSLQLLARFDQGPERPPPQEPENSN